MRSVIFGFLVFLVVISTGCGNVAQETKLDAMLQRPEPQDVDNEVRLRATGFHLAMRRAEYETARSLLSEETTYESYSEMAKRYYLLDEGIMGIKIIGDDLIPWTSNKYQNETYGSMARLRANVLTTYGWQAIDYYLRDDAAGNPSASGHNWKVIFMMTPEFLEAEDF